MADAGFTPIPNCLLDRMAEMKPAEFKALMAVYRLVMGYKEYRERRRRHISITKLQDFAGLSRQGVINAMNALEEYGYVTKVETDSVNEWLVNSVDQKTGESGQDSVPVVNSVDGTSQHSLPPSNKRKVSKEINTHTAREEMPADAPPIHSGFAFEHEPAGKALEWQHQIDEMAAALSTVTGIDIGLNKPKLEADAIALLENGYTPDQVTSGFYGEKSYWRLMCYGGQKGDTPKLGNIRAEIANSVRWDGVAPSTNGHHANGRVNKNELKDNLWAIVTRSKDYQEARGRASPDEWKMLTSMGKWRDVRGLNETTFSIRFYEVYKQHAGN